MSDNTQGQNAVDYFMYILQLVQQNLPEKLHGQDIGTIHGKTQKSESSIIHMIKEILIEHDILFTQASSQQPYDFRIPMKGYQDCQPSEQDIRNKNIVVGNDYKTLLLEIKKTESNKVMCNDTLPTPFVFYIIIRKKKNTKIPLTCSHIQGTRGNIENNPEREKYIEEIHTLRTKCKQLKGDISMFPRCNFAWYIGGLYTDK